MKNDWELLKQKDIYAILDGDELLGNSDNITFRITYHNHGTIVLIDFIVFFLKILYTLGGSYDQNLRYAHLPIL